MVKRTKVQGCKKQSQELVINTDTVYVHSNVVKLESPTSGEDLYQYDEIEYTLDEWNTKITNVYNVPDVKVVNIVDDFTLNLIQMGVL